MKKSCESYIGKDMTDYRFNYLPSCGNPQKVKHVVEPWVRGGEHTRDYVRRVDFVRKCLNKKNNKIIDNNYDVS